MFGAQRLAGKRRLPDNQALWAIRVYWLASLQEGGNVARIYFLDDNNEPQVVEVTPESGDILIGRASTCAIRTAGHSVSRLHARIGWQDGLFVLEDLGSSNGTWYFTERLEPNVPVILEDGVLFRAGAFELRFERDPIDVTLEQPVVFDEEGQALPQMQIPPPPLNIPPPPMDIPPPPSAPPPPPDHGPAPADPEPIDWDLPEAPVSPKPPSIGISPAMASQVAPAVSLPEPEDLEAGADTDSLATLTAQQQEVKVRVSSQDLDRAPWEEPADSEDSEDPQEPAADVETADPSQSDLPTTPLQEPTPLHESPPQAPVRATPAAADGGDLETLRAELVAAKEEADARTMLWRLALADLADVRQELAAAEQENQRLLAELNALRGQTP